VTSINNVRVKNLRHAAELIRDASGEFITFTLGGRDGELVFRRQQLLDMTDQILEDEGIRHPCSENLRCVWEKKAENKAE
jgi:hypothetical protein